jgi:hypothetical protein
VKNLKTHETLQQFFSIKFQIPSILIKIFQILSNKSTFKDDILKKIFKGKAGEKESRLINWRKNPFVLRDYYRKKRSRRDDFFCCVLSINFVSFTVDFEGEIERFGLD